MKKKISKWFGDSWAIIKYQLLTKIVFVMLIIPLYKVVFDYALKSTGRTSITSGDFIGFFLSPQGIGIIVITILLGMIFIAQDLNAIIILSDGIEKGEKYISAKKVFKEGFKSIKKLMNLSGICIISFIFLILPLSGIGVSISVLKNFKIPNFITSVIYNTPLYFTIYMVAILIFVLVSILSIFTLHFILLKGYKGFDAVKSSFNLVRKYKKIYFKKFILFNIVMLLVSAVIIFTTFVIFIVSMGGISLETYGHKFAFILYCITVYEIMTATLFLSVPFIIRRLTKVFYILMNEEDIKINTNYDISRKNVAENKRRTPVIRLGIAIGLVILFNMFIALIMTEYFDEFFLQNNRIQIVAHRGGGDLSAENSLDGIKKAIDKGAKWTEIDVQRTKDGKYVINHDNTFKRLSGVDKASFDMTLDEIKTLKIADKFDETRDSQDIATIEEVLDVAKGKIGVYIELKGATADKKMADDIVKLVKEKEMEKEVALISLDYSMIQYIEEKYPDIDTGFLYYFSFGDFLKLKGDILIMEEGEATDENIDKLHEIGKTAVVWTVNTPESIEKFTNSQVDGIITDYVLKVEKQMEENKKKDPFMLIIDTIFR